MLEHKLATNNLDFEKRLRIGKTNEKRVLALLNKHRPVVCHTIWDKWVVASEQEDISQKIDAWATSGLAPTRKSVQVKYRESGGDLGIALIRPFNDFNAFKRGYENGQVDYDRDFQNTPDFYACLAGNVLTVIEGEKVTKGCSIMLEQFVAYGGFTSGRSFSQIGRAHV